MRIHPDTYIIGIDEVGRGPLAGPLCLCAYTLQKKDLALLRKMLIRDSKKMTPVQRSSSAQLLHRLVREGKAYSVYASVTAAQIDEQGLSQVIKYLINKVLVGTLKKINRKPHEVMVYLDGGLYAPEEFLSQETIIKGDDLIPVISCASIVAKVKRDRYMIRLHKKFPQYGFDEHKGYGTLTHRKAIKKYGISSFHRKSFLKKFIA
jgi:ribonuclease HII